MGASPLRQQKNEADYKERNDYGGYGPTKRESAVVEWLVEKISNSGT
jgi:hypothetical protein